MYTWVLIDGEWCYYEKNKKLEIPSDWYVDRIKSCFLASTPDGLVTMNDQLEILYKFDEDISCDYEGPYGYHSIFGLMNIRKYLENALIDSYGNFIIPFGEYYIGWE